MFSVSQLAAFFPDAKFIDRGLVSTEDLNRKNVRTNQLQLSILLLQSNNRGMLELVLRVKSHGAEER